jgi:(R,R)-butanediol dehydrogenase/meso-butanediol dehydrogenase/diacetyl reductase
MGHEFSGEVVEVGDGVEDLAKGDLVAVEPLETCGKCVHCRSGHYNHCPLVAFHGYNREGGGLSDYTVVRRSMAHKLPKGVTPMQGALIEPMSVAYHTADRCRVESGQTVAIHGAGPIGVGVYLALRKRGVKTIIIDPSPMRRGVLKALGAETLVDPTNIDVPGAVRDLTRGLGADASVDAAGVPAAFRAALLGTAVDGTAVVVAIHGQPLVIPPFDILMPEVYLTGVAMFCNTFPKVIADMAAGVYPTTGWVDTIAFESLVSDGFERLHRQEGMKLLVEVAKH